MNAQDVAAAVFASQASGQPGRRVHSEEATFDWRSAPALMSSAILGASFSLAAISSSRSTGAVPAAVHDSLSQTACQPHRACDSNASSCLSARGCLGDLEAEMQCCRVSNDFMHSTHICSHHRFPDKRQPGTYISASLRACHMCPVHTMETLSLRKKGGVQGLTCGIPVAMLVQLQGANTS